MKLLLFLCMSILFISTTTASNIQRELRIADQIIKNLNQGEPLWLGEPTSQFLALHMQPSTNQILGGVILLHNIGANPNTADVIHPLRISLADQGWETLSIQLPLASHDAETDEYEPMIPEAAPRIQSAIDFFTSKQDRNLILLGHGLGARMGLTYLDKSPTQAIRGFVAIGLATKTGIDANSVLDVINKLNIPMLDIYGSRDLESVTRSARLRHMAAIRSAQNVYRLDRVVGADHHFRGLETTLQSRVGGWLKRTAADMEEDSMENANPPP